MKTVKEVSVKLENKPGTLSGICELLGAGGINILALTVRTDGDSGTLSFVATDPFRAVNILQSAGHSPSVHEIIAAETPHHPGGLNAILKPLRLAGVNVEHLYSCIGSSGWFCRDRSLAWGGQSCSGLRCIDKRMDQALRRRILQFLICLQGESSLELTIGNRERSLKKGDQPLKSIH